MIVKAKMTKSEKENITKSNGNILISTGSKYIWIKICLFFLRFFFFYPQTVIVLFQNKLISHTHPPPTRLPFP